jgi:hypothetical protein
LILAIADQPLIFEGSEIAYDVALASRRYYRGQRGADRLERGWRGSRLISGSTANNSNAGLAKLTK